MPAGSFVAAVAPTVSFKFVETLTPNPGHAAHAPNRQPRQVTSGHYVPVPPRALPDPEYVMHSRSLLREAFGGAVTDEMAQSAEFVRFFSGDVAGALKASGAPNDVAQVFRREGWATGYALSIMGQEFYDQCPFRNGNGYGDGRAMSILEINNPASGRWEFQLKGGGPTPYCRGADGRAVLRSSIREFLAAEAMHAMGIRTARALSLITSKTETVRRPWYSEDSKSANPNVLIDEHVAITTRVAPSMVRVGQLELFGRRARKKEYPAALRELVDLVSFAMDREYADLGSIPAPFTEDGGETAAITPAFLAHVLKFATAFRGRLAELIAGWVRVGFCQGNYNADNCAVGGRALDYGPFGFMEMFDPEFQSWSGGGKHYSFLGVPNAAAANFQMFAVALLPLFDAAAEDGARLKEELVGLTQNYPALLRNSLNGTFAAKLGLKTFDRELFASLVDTIGGRAAVDYTIFFRELSELPETPEPLHRALMPLEAGEGVSDDMRSEFDTALTPWLAKWRDLLQAQHGTGKEDDGSWKDAVNAQMKSTNPKFIPREWMLREAYRTAIDHREYTVVRDLHDLLTDPYDTGASGACERRRAAWTEAYYRPAPPEMLNKGGVAVMT